MSKSENIEYINIVLRKSFFPTSSHIGVYLFVCVKFISNVIKNWLSVSIKYAECIQTMSQICEKKVVCCLFYITFSFNKLIINGIHCIWN